MASQPIPRTTPEEYLAWEREAEVKHEYFDGEIVAMAGASFVHSIIVANLTRELSLGLKNSGCLVLGSDLRVSIAPSLLCYPDITIACPPFEFFAKPADTLANPSFLIEVLSPSTRAADRSLKLPRYRSLPSLDGYLFVEQDRMFVEYGKRISAEEWQVNVFTNKNDQIEFTSLSCTIDMLQIYADVDVAA